MSKIDSVLNKDDLNFNEIEEFLEKFDEINCYKILNRINKFGEYDRKKVCEEIIKKSKNENIIDRACMEIITFIEYEYEYYRKIIDSISTLNYQSTWINEMKNKLIEDSPKTMQLVFEDFSSDKPNNIDFDIEMINRLLNIYDEKYIELINLNREQIVVSCIRLNNIMSFSIMNILNLFVFFDNKVKFSEDETKRIIKKFFFDFPYTCKRFIEENINYDNNSVFIKYLKEKIKKFDEEEKIKYSMKIFKPDVKRVNSFRKYQLEQNKEIKKKAQKYSVVLDLCKTSTVLYGRKYGMAVTTKDAQRISIVNMQEFKYECPYPLSYIIDPVEYTFRINSLKVLGKEE